MYMTCAIEERHVFLDSGRLKLLLSIISFIYDPNCLPSEHSRSTFSLIIASLAREICHCIMPIGSETMPYNLQRLPAK